MWKFYFFIILNLFNISFITVHTEEDNNYTNSTILNDNNNSFFRIEIDFDKYNLSLNSDYNYTLELSEQENNTFCEQVFAKFPVNHWIRYGWFSKEDISMINPHWMKFIPPSDQAHYCLAALYAFIFLIGCSGNLIVIFMFIRCKSLRTAGNILICNLALSDFSLLAVMPFFIYNSILRGPAIGFYGCQIYGFMGGLSGSTSIITLTAIALERYQVIAYPLQPLRRRGQRTRAYACAVFSWLYSLSISNLPLTIPEVVGRYVPEGYLTSCSFEYLNNNPKIKYFIWSFFVAAWVIPFLIIVLCYIKIFFAVAKSQKAARSSRQRERQSREVRLAIISLGLVSLWFVAWTPYAVIALLGVTGQHELITPFNSMTPALSCKFAAAIDPYVYAISNPRFRGEIQKWFTTGEGPLSKFVQRIIEKQSRRNKIEDIPEMDYEVCSTTNLSMWPPANPPVPAKGFRPPKPKSDRSTSFRFRSSIEEETL